MNEIDVSVILLTLNAGEKFRKVLKSVFNQTYKAYEVIIIDSSSIDDTLEYAKRYPIRIFKIPPWEFGHGKTRNMAANLAKGKYLVYLTQDAIPCNKRWLENLIKNFKDYHVGGVFGKQIPLQNSPLPDTFSYSEDFPDKKEVITVNNFFNRNVIFSNVNSAIRKKVLKKYPFKKDILICEDIYWASFIIRKGFSIVYEPDATVVHSHIYSLFKIFKLYFDEGVGYSQMDKTYDQSAMIKNSFHRFFCKINFLIKKKQYYWVIYTILVDFTRFIALNLGRNNKYLTNRIKRKMSNFKYYWI